MNTVAQAQKTTPELSSPMTVCFVCTGNTCRSPMAQAYLLSRLGERELRVLSAGIDPIPGQPISENAVAALQAYGIAPTADNPYTSHCARALTELTVLSCDRIICMTPSHAMQVMLRYPAAASRVESMPLPIPDPFGGDEETYRRCLDAIAQGIDALFAL